jgi:riboflavin synthase
MFTGIIHHQGFFKGFRQGKRELALEVPPSFPLMETGESVAIDGACLSLTRREGNLLFFSLSQATLEKTNLGCLNVGERLNLELPLTPQSPLGGHLVTGHIDGKGKIMRITERKPGKRLTISFPPDLRPYFVSQGSVAVNGVSLTIAEMKSSSFDVELIPVTIEKSNLAGLKRGDEVNLECDIFGKYVYNWLNKGKTKR